MALTAAHKSLKFGTLLKVTNPKNGRSVIVRINDRGPYIEGRDLDLSKGAAIELGMLSKGVARVKIEEVSLSEKINPTVMVN
jgi:rare lipoprotein A